ncbi:MAG: CinA family protein [Mariprofundaceae bacterium]|nr:CinA family protein [Mariprofundaceae bacterium]
MVRLMMSVESLLTLCRQLGVKLRTAESCTAGAVAAAIASVSGASDVLDRGWVTYSNQAKIDELSVPEPYLKQYGAVSQPVVEAMAQAGSDDGILCVALSGIAGPSGGSLEKPVGTVWIAVAYGQAYVQSTCYHFKGERVDIQQQAVRQALEDCWCVCYEQGKQRGVDANA